MCYHRLSRKRKKWARKKERGVPLVEIAVEGDGPLYYDHDGNYEKNTRRRALPQVPPGQDFFVGEWDCRLIYVIVVRKLDAQLVEQAFSQLLARFFDGSCVAAHFFDLARLSEVECDQPLNLTSFLV
jgi:hypothetical protein